MTPVPTDRIAAGARALEELRAEVGSLCARRDLDLESWKAWERRASLFRTKVAEFYTPFDAAASALRAGDPAGLETAVRFLEADPWCFRSGYLKSLLMYRMANHGDIESHRGRLQDVVVHRLRHPQPRLLHPTVRLAATVWDEGLQDRVVSLADATSPMAERLRAFTHLVDHQIRTVRGLRQRGPAGAAAGRRSGPKGG